MIEAGRTPGRSPVAIVTLSRCLYMLRMLASRRNPVMTPGTGSRCKGAVIKCGWTPGCSPVAIITNLGTLHMTDILAFCNNTVMTA